MKKTMILTSLFAAAISLMACSNETDITYAPQQNITIAQKSLSIGNNGGSISVEVSSDHEFAAYTNDAWLTVSPTNSTGKTATLTITAEPNTGAERTGKVVIWSGGSRDSISVVQSAGQQEDIKCPLSGYELVWNDEFSGSKVGSDWTWEVKPAGWVNNELQNYVQDDKVAQGLTRLNEEDPSFTVVNNAETHQMVLSCAGDMQVDVLVSKLKSRFNVEVALSPVRVAYREKNRKTVQKQGRHKKQTGGSGQFGDVWIRFEPQTEQDDMIFAEEVFGGSVPKNYFPAVEKGLREACAHGPLAGYPVVNLKAVLYDGSYHPVDSSEIAFKTAAQLAFKAALPEANPCLMEPVGELKVTVPDSYMGDVMGDLNKRRGRVMGMDPAGNGEQVITAEVPMGEMSTYAIDLRSMTQSRGTFTLHFVRYEDCPPAAQEKAIAEAKARNEE